MIAKNKGIGFTIPLFFLLAARTIGARGKIIISHPSAFCQEENYTNNNLF